MADTFSDFPDRLSPMLVKELRQGLRAKTFVAVFLSFQALLALILLSASASGGSGSVGNVISNVIFTFFAIAVLVIQPLRGIGAVSSEVKGNTLDMMVLTRLSAARIVYGKWFALVSQSGLIFATVIPYLIFRYFLGQMNLVGEIVVLVLLFLTSMTVTAVTVGLSASSSVILRVLVPVIAIPVFGWMTLFAIFSSSFRGNSIYDVFSLDTPDARINTAIFVLALIYLGWSMLSMGISIIAPSAENHATLRRLVTLVLVIAASVFVVSSTAFDKDFIALLYAFIAAPAFATALTERSYVTPSVTASFDKWGIVGKLGRLFLFPGWPSGVIFTLLVSSIFAASVFIRWPEFIIRDSHQLQVMSVLGMLLFPAVIVTLLRTDEVSRISTYLLILLASMVFTLVIITISEALNNEELLWFFIWSPLNIIPLRQMSPLYQEYLLHASCGVTILYALLLLAAAIFAMRSTKSSTGIPETA